MKRPFSLLVFALFSFFILLACDLDVENPSPKPEEQLQQTLPQVLYYSSAFTASDLARYQLIWMQQQSAVRGSHFQVEKYNMDPTYLDDQWNFFYYNIFLGSQNMIALATEIEAYAYRGISRIILAYSLGLMTDTWGDIPYEYAMQYFSGLYPPYDEQNDVYDTLFDLLDSGIEDLELAQDNQGLEPSANEDLIYHGDLDKWKRAANMMKMRYLLRLANISGDYNSIITIAQSGEAFNGLQDDMIFEFSPNLGANNPHFENDNSVKNTRMGKFLVDMLIENDDPRLPVFVEKNMANEYAGSAPGEGFVNASFIGEEVASPDSPLPLLTYTEQKFIEAEVYYYLQMNSLADEAFEQAVKSSLEFYGVSDAEWEEVNAQVENVSLEQIINAKYIALFLQPEVWTDFRRTGFPQIDPYEGVEENQIPVRFVYPSSEIQNNNVNVPGDVDIFTSLWWDMEDSKF